MKLESWYKKIKEKRKEEMLENQTTLRIYTTHKPNKKLNQTLIYSKISPIEFLFHLLQNSYYSKFFNSYTPKFLQLNLNHAALIITNFNLID